MLKSSRICWAISSETIGSGSRATGPAAGTNAAAKGLRGLEVTTDATGRLAKLSLLRFLDEVVLVLVGRIVMAELKVEK